MSHEPPKNPEVKKEGAHPPKKKERKIVRTDQALPAWIWISFTAIFLLFIAHSCREQSKEEGTEAQAQTGQRADTAIVQSTATRRLLELKFDGYTPCSPTLDYPFELDTQGGEISMQFPGIEEPIYYSGKGTLIVPTNRLSGPVKITSNSPYEEVRVRVWKIVKINGHQ